MQNMTPEQMQAYMMMMQSQPSGLMSTGPSDSSITANLLKQGGGSAPTSSIGQGLTSVGKSIGDAINKKTNEKRRQKAEDERLEKMIAAMKDKV